jgi:hypothetical protein
MHPTKSECATVARPKKDVPLEAAHGICLSAGSDIG